MTIEESNATSAAGAQGGAPGVLLDVRGLRISFPGSAGRIVALHEVDLTIRAGEVIALVGESGSGKSTLSNAIIGLLPDTAEVSGSIRFGGRELVGLREKDMIPLRGTEIALVPQDPGASLDPVQTVGAQLREIFSISREHRGRSRAELDEKAAGLLRLVGVDRPDERLRQYPHELSGGLKQRVLIAIAFGRNPRLLIADEPTSALDVTVQKQVLEVFDRLAREFGTAVILVTHDLALATDHASRVVVLRSGAVREDKPTGLLLSSAEDPYTIQLLREGAPLTEHADATLQGAHTVEAPAIVVAGLGKTFGSHRAVHDVSFSVAAGTTFSLVGESGSGKSTTAKMVMRLLDATSGSITIHGTEVSALRGKGKRELWRSIQLVYQNPDSALDPRWTVGELVAEPLRSFRVGTKAERRERVLELLAQVNLSAASIDRRARELSGGQRQRVAIARALALGARVLVLDEALSALDVLTQAQILDLLDDLQKRLGLSYLFISHDLHVVRRISHTVGVMNGGRLVEVGPAAQVFDAPRSDYTRELLAANPGSRLGKAAREAAWA